MAGPLTDRMACLGRS